MHVMNVLGLILLLVIGIIILLIIAITAYHYYQLKNEAEYYLPPGKMVDVNNRKMHVYGDGKGDITLVFLAGHGTSCPAIDFKPLWMRLINDYRIAVVERAGYGWSETSSSPRDLDTVLEETRKALEGAGEKPPYILVPHSMSGLEALYWAQNHPQEVKAIIGLDPLVPDFVEQSIELPTKANLNLMYAISRMGISRLMPRSEMGKTLPLIDSKELSQEDKEQFLALFYRSAFTKDMLREVDFLKDNAKKVQSKKAQLETPLYFFISDGKEVPGEGWRELLGNYVMQSAAGKYMLLDCGHYVHHHGPDIIAEEMKGFISQIIR